MLWPIIQVRELNIYHEREAGMARVLQHHLNCMHLLCRLMTLGISKATALRFACLWERYVHPWLYRNNTR